MSRDYIGEMNRLIDAAIAKAGGPDAFLGPDDGQAAEAEAEAVIEAWALTLSAAYPEATTAEQLMTKSHGEEVAEAMLTVESIKRARALSGGPGASR